MLLPVVIINPHKIWYLYHFEVWVIFYEYIIHGKEVFTFWCSQKEFFLNLLQKLQINKSLRTCSRIKISALGTYPYIFHHLLQALMMSCNILGLYYLSYKYQIYAWICGYLKLPHLVKKRYSWLLRYVKNVESGTKQLELWFLC
jgi:hypothetical protein